MVIKDNRDRLEEIETEEADGEEVFRQIKLDICRVDNLFKVHGSNIFGDELVAAPATMVEVYDEFHLSSGDDSDSESGRIWSKFVQIISM